MLLYTTRSYYWHRMHFKHPDLYCSFSFTIWLTYIWFVCVCAWCDVRYSSFFLQWVLFLESFFIFGSQKVLPVCHLHFTLQMIDVPNIVYFIDQYKIWFVADGKIEDSFDILHTTWGIANKNVTHWILLLFSITQSNHTFSSKYTKHTHNKRANLITPTLRFYHNYTLVELTFTHIYMWIRCFIVWAFYIAKNVVFFLLNFTAFFFK